MNTARIQKPAQRLTDIMEQQDRSHEEKSRKQRQPPFSHRKVLHALRQDHPDRRTFRGKPKAQKCDAGFMKDRMRKQEDKSRNKLRDQVRRHMAERDIKLSFSELLRDLHVLALF